MLQFLQVLTVVLVAIAMGLLCAGAAALAVLLATRP